MSNNKPELLRNIADSMEKDPDGWWRKFEIEYGGIWSPPIGPNDLLQKIIIGSVRPLPHTITINVEVPEPMQSEPEVGQSYYFISAPGSIGCAGWDGDRHDQGRFRRGIWSTMAEAKAADEAIFGALGVSRQEDTES